MTMPIHALDWQRPWSEPRDAIAARERSDEYAWRLFVALNWPADAATGAADAAGSLSADRPTVWESWANANDIYRDDGADPGPYAPQRSAGSTPAQRFETGSLKTLPNLRHIVRGKMVSSIEPLADAARLTEVHMNRASFEYIRGRELYNLDGQIRAYETRTAVAFPAGAKQVKASWRPISEAERARYHTLEVTMVDGSRRLYGLTALHIVTKDLPSWFWATFEHVDNAHSDGEGWQLPSRDTFACGETVADCNRTPSGIGLEGTVWENYRLRGTLTSFVDAQGRPLKLANSELERGMQSTSSCVTCHARTATAVIAGQVERLPVFDERGADPVAEDRRGFLGVPRPEWYATDTAAGAVTFLPLDFVWSMAKAQPQHQSSSP
jgi:hypothetical protein